VSSDVVIATDGVSKRFGTVQALSDVTVTITDAATGLLGANGAGKSTLMRIMLGLVVPDRGGVRVLGVDARHDGDQIRRRVGYMPEHDCLPREMTAADLVVQLAELRGLPRRAAVLRASEVLFQVGLDEERSRLIQTFSTGMKQRVKLAQALVHGPELVVLDEPTNGLDPTGRAEMLSLVRRLSADLGVRVILSSHLLEDIHRTCDAVVVLRDGVVAAAGPLATLAAATATRVRVRLVGEPAGFVSALHAAGLASVVRDDAMVIVDCPDDAALGLVRDAAATAQVGIRELANDTPTIEDVLVSALEGDEA
jgi:ABC-2 type transport system ATP-binding protein